MTLDIEHIARQEQELRLPSFDPDLAWRLGTRLRDMAVARGANVAIDISRLDYTLLYCTVGATTLDNAEWVRRKKNVVRRFQRSSYAVGLSLKLKQTTLLLQYGLPESDYASHGGCFPVHVAGAGMIGTVTVSGLPQRADHEFVVEALCAELNRPYEEVALPH